MFEYNSCNCLIHGLCRELKLFIQVVHGYSCYRYLTLPILNTFRYLKESAAGNFGRRTTNPGFDHKPQNPSPRFQYRSGTGYFFGGKGFI